MNGGRVGQGFAAGLVLATLLASCGGGDDGPAVENSAATRTSDVLVGAGTQGGADDSSATAPTSGADTGDESSAASASGETPSCDAIFSMAEMEEFFAEPVALTEETNDSLGQLVCTWGSIEDPDDLEDMAFKTLVVQLYSGDPIDAANFFDPSIFESVTTIDGIGDLAYRADDLGPSFYFVDEPVGGSLSYTEVDMGDADAPKLHTIDDVEQLFTTFHDRVT